MKQYKKQEELNYLTDFYKTETKNLMERGYSNSMVVACYHNTLDHNSLLDKPKDLGNLEGLMCKYLTKEL